MKKTITFDNGKITVRYSFFGLTLYVIEADEMAIVRGSVRQLA